MKRVNINIVNFIKKNKKQIIFALFTILINIFTNNRDIALCAAPVIAAAGVAANAATGTASAAAGTAGVAAGTAGVAAGTTGAVAGTTGAAAGTAGAAAGTAGAAGTTARTVGANETGGINNMSSSRVSGVLNKKSNSSSNSNIIKNNTNKNYNPSSNISTGKSNFSSETSLIGDTFDDIKDNIPTSNNIKSKIKESLKNTFNKDNKSNNDESDFEGDADVSFDSASSQVLDGPAKALFGCFGAFLILTVIVVAVVFTVIASPIMVTVSGISNAIDKVGNISLDNDEGTGFFDKVGNLFKYGNYGTNYEVITDEVEEVRDDILKEYDVNINVPLVLATILSDSENMKTSNQEEMTEDGNKGFVITDEMMNRIQYIKDVAMLQVVSDSVVFRCSVKVVDGINEYYEDVIYENIDSSNIEEGVCNQNTVGMLLKHSINDYEDDTYFERLHDEKELLINIYSEYEEYEDNDDEFDRLIDNIEMQYQVFNIMFMQLYETQSAGNIPMVLMSDPNINLQSPLKGNITITSPYGMRVGEFAGMHEGIDAVSNDKNIYAAGDGIVTRRYTEKEGGNIIQITHTASDGKEYISLYAHMDRFLVNLGDEVKAGDVIGIMGASGITSGPHLHFQFKDVESGKYLNPKNLF